MALNVAVQMDPIDRINIAGDSTFALLLEARARGHRLSYYTPDKLSLRDGRVVAETAPVEVRDVVGDHVTLGGARATDLASFEVGAIAGDDGPEDIVVELTDGYVDKDGACYDTAVFRHATGEDEERIATLVRENPSRAKNALMARCLRALGDMAPARVEALGTAIFSEMTLADRARVEEALDGGGPGLHTRREVECANCGRTFAAGLDLTNFLARSS